MDAKKKANTLVRKYKTRNPFEIIKGINVIPIICHLDGVRGFYQYFQRNNLIYISEDLDKFEQKLVCAHELGHMFLHKKSNALFMDTRTLLNVAYYENEANTFAMNLLVPDDELSEFQGYSLDQISRVTGYSEELLKLRLK